MSTVSQVDSCPTIRSTPAAGRFFLSLVSLLWLLWAAALVGSYVVSDGLWSGILRLTSSVVLVTLAWSAAIEWRRRQLGQLTWATAAGMTLGCLGDFAMSDLFAWLPIGNPVLAGMVLFGCGHLAYVLGCESARRQLRLRYRVRWWVAFFVWQAVNAAAWAWVILPSERHQVLSGPALAYGALLAGTAGMTTGLATMKRSFSFMAAGAALFFFSDFMIALRLFQPSASVEPLIWATYGPGQMLIVIGALLVAARE